MVFNSVAFIVFFAIVSVLMILTNIKRDIDKKTIIKIRHIILLIASCVFYGWWDIGCLVLMLALIFIAYICSIMMKKINNKVYLIFAVTTPLIILGIFKYFNFFIETFATAFGIKNIATLNILLPVGISFYTFQSLSYTLDVYRGRIEPEKSFIKVALYVSFFPQLVAGPIVKADDFIPQLYEDRTISWSNFEKGIQWFVFGLFKKVVIADNISVCVDAVFNAPQQFHAISIVLAVIGYSIQIYCDFSGYSDMAIGCAKCLGFDLMRNFNIPYVANNISAFWKRWHISLSTWLQEYLYIPLGGNRKGNIRTYINLFLTMLIGGLWHGASWTFVAWGALHGIALCLHKIWLKIIKRDKGYKGTFIGNLCSGMVTYVFVTFCWIFFRAGNFHIAKEIIFGILFWQNGIFYISSWVIFGVVCVLISTLIAYVKSVLKKSEFNGFYPTLKLNTILGQTVLFVMIGITIGLAYTGSNPFIYFQF